MLPSQGRQGAQITDDIIKDGCSPRPRQGAHHGRRGLQLFGLRADWMLVWYSPVELSLQHAQLIQGNASKQQSNICLVRSVWSLVLKQIAGLTVSEGSQGGICNMICLAC